MARRGHRGGGRLIRFGKVALRVWALGLGSGGLTLVLGAGNAALTGFANGTRMGFVVLVARGTRALVGLFLTLGGRRE